MTFTTLALCTALGAAAQDPAAPPPPEPTAAARAWFALPVAFYLPETRLGFGVIGGLHFAAGPGLPPSSLHPQLLYTVNRQLLVDLPLQLFPNPSLAITGRAHYADFPSWFYGVGNRAPPAAKEPFASRYVEAGAAVEYFLWPGRLRSGPKVQWRTEAFRDLQPGGQLASGAVDGARGFTAASLGWSLTYDSRDNLFFPRTGRYLEAWALQAPAALGDHAAFGRAAVEGRQFLSLGEGRVLGVAAHLEGAWGAVPFTLLPALGGDRLLRGYREGRYRDRLLYSVQAEFRFPVWRRLGAAAFLGASDVARTLSGFGPRTVRAAFGGGLRWRLTEDGMNARLDVGHGGDGTNLYVVLLEAF